MEKGWMVRQLDFHRSLFDVVVIYNLFGCKSLNLMGPTQFIGYSQTTCTIDEKTNHLITIHPFRPTYLPASNSQNLTNSTIYVGLKEETCLSTLIPIYLPRGLDKYPMHLMGPYISNKFSQLDLFSFSHLSGARLHIQSIKLLLSWDPQILVLCR